MRPHPSSAARTFVAGPSGFLLDGKPFQIVSGEMHYPRIPREYWRDRFRKAKAMGLNTVCTYVFWNVHEPRPGRFDFEGNADVAAFLRTAQEEGLWAIVRPGPYVCSEWEFGGYPAWLLKDPDLVVRSLHKKFTARVERYMRRLGEELAPLMLSRGGPILMAQVENEYGSYGCDRAYLAWSEKVLRDSGFDCQLFTSNGASDAMLSGGTLPHLPAAINFGGDAKGQFANLQRFRPEGPRMNAEFWCGWFDHWGSPHSATSVEAHAEDLRWMLEQGHSVNFYMFHGGTNPGFMAGANWNGKYEPDITSYDYDAPLNEAGEPTPKFEAFRSVVKSCLKTSLPELPEPLEKIAIPRFELRPFAGIEKAIVRKTRSARPKSMEEMDQAYGFVLYRSAAGPFEGELRIEGLADYALAMADGEPLGELMRDRQTSLRVHFSRRVCLEILVHNLGRVNFGHKLPGERKGILGGVFLGGREVLDWETCSIPCDRIGRVMPGGVRPGAPAFYRAEFSLEETGDTHLDLRGWGLGAVWVNGRNIGRYWHVGPQQSLFLPAVWLREGRNEIVVLDVLDRPVRSIEGLLAPVWANG